MDLEQWNNEQNVRILYCPYCGKKLLKGQSDALYRKASVEEISDMIKEHLLKVLYSGDVSVDDIAEYAWEREVWDTSVFYSNYRADLFVARHAAWVDRGFEYIADSTLDFEYLTKLQVSGNDCFLVEIFLYATKHYIFDQLGIAEDEGDLSKKRIKEIIRLVNTTDYDGQF
jgi:hypothetical protein